MITPVSSPTTHSAMRVGRGLREAEGADLPLFRTVLQLTTLTVNVWPVVPGFSWSTFTNTGFLLAAVAVVGGAVAGVVAMGYGFEARGEMEGEMGENA